MAPLVEREDFNVLTPPVRVTDPKGFEKFGTTRMYQRFPAAMYPRDGESIRVENQAEEAKALEAGYHITPWNAKDLAEDDARLAEEMATAPVRVKAAK